MVKAYILWWFGPVFAAHRFYLGAYRSGAAMIIAWMIWCLLDAFLIPGLMRRYRASQSADTLAHVFA